MKEVELLLGCRLIVNPLLIKAEKIPGESQPWMGIQAFSQPMEYVLLCLVLMFLEEKQPEEQFVLDQVTTFLQSHYPEDGLLDWTIFAHRRALIHVLRFCENESMILTNDGDDKSFEGNGTSAVLYENTGASKYFMRHFTFDVLLCHHYEEIAQNEWQGTDVERGIIRRHLNLAYSGDFDPEGLVIAQKLKSRFGDFVSWICYSPEYYKMSLSKNTLNSKRLSQLNSITDSELVKVAELMKELGRAGYQEVLLDEIVSQCEYV